MDDINSMVGFAKYSNPNMLVKHLCSGEITTGIVDEFLENEYEFLVLCGYNVSRGKNRIHYNDFDECDEEEDDVFSVNFYVRKRPVNSFSGVRGTYSMTDMKDMVGVTFRIDKDSDDLDLSTIMVRTLTKHEDEIYDDMPHLLELDGLFGIRAQSSEDRYMWGYGTSHTLYITHIEIRARHGEYYWYDRYVCTNR